MHFFLIMNFIFELFFLPSIISFEDLFIWVTETEGEFETGGHLPCAVLQAGHTPRAAGYWHQESGTQPGSTMCVAGD